MVSKMKQLLDQIHRQYMLEQILEMCITMVGMSQMNSHHQETKKDSTRWKETSSWIKLLV